MDRTERVARAIVGLMAATAPNDKQYQGKSVDEIIGEASAEEAAEFRAMTVAAIELWDALAQ